MCQLQTNMHELLESLISVYAIQLLLCTVRDRLENISLRSLAKAVFWSVHDVSLVLRRMSFTQLLTPLFVSDGSNDCVSYTYLLKCLHIAHGSNYL